ncbi:uncharacterized protein LOC124196224 isoform X1 [Daphnia pulex]|uniref:uncharacterized protein LOC124196224 isoform X1 n=1 Tax=Daphnia pulex TaxID=6669 RepID=UPI001EDFA2D7|nr:uncharacterized protein LOC124196224 isoform X1 [Daphnia pulex]
MQYPSLAGNVIHSLVLPEWISGYEKYTLYPRMTQQKSSQPVYWENTMNIRNPKSDWLEYELVSYLNPHDLKSLVWASERKFQAQNCKMQQLWLLRNREEKETIRHLPLLSFIVLRVGHLSAGIILGMREAICQMSLSFVSLTMGRLSSLTLRLAANAGNNLPFFPFVHPTDDRLWPPYAPNNTTTGNDFVARGR